MKAIWKVPLEITDEQTVNLPWGAEPLTVQVQGDELCLWAKVDTTNPGLAHTVHIYGTGNPIPDEDPDYPEAYIGTVQTHGGALVWHVFWV